MNVLQSSPTKETGLVKYDTMCRAIAAAAQIDEVKEMRDQAIAIERYAQQALNMDAERQAREIRLRAERKVGELIKEQQKTGTLANKNGGQKSRQNQHSAGVTRRDTCKTDKSEKLIPSKTLADIGISRNQSSKFQRLAEVPEKEFEEALADKNVMPSTVGLIAKVSGSEGKIHPSAIWIKSRIQDFEREHMAALNPKEAAHEMTEGMIKEVIKGAPKMITWLQQLIIEVKNVKKEFPNQ